MVAAVVLVDTMFYAAISPLLPYYVHHFHLAKSQAGVLAASYAAGTLVGSIPAGWLAARIGVRSTIVCGLGLMILASLAFAFAPSTGPLDIARFVQGLGGAASWAAGLAWLIERAPEDRRAEMIGASLAAAIVGAVLGPVLGTVAAETTPGIAFSAVAGLGLGLLLWTLTEPAPAPGGITNLRGLAPALHDPGVLTGMWLTTLAAMLYSTLAVLAPLRLSRLGASTATVGLAFVAGAALAAASTPLVGRLSDRRGWRRPILTGLCLSAGWALLLTLPRTILLLFGLVVVADSLFGVPYSPAGAMISERAERVGLGQAYGFGLFNLAWAGGQVIGGAGSAALAQATADAVPYSLLAGVCLLTVAAIARRPRGRVTVAG
ncbi:MAG TPA: MFS transporter [Solirubrobacteraceae bacterium]|nr:MFS transporter [Solirubrobacteraceae bacterium]